MMELQQRIVVERKSRQKQTHSHRHPVTDRHTHRLQYDSLAGIRVDGTNRHDVGCRPVITNHGSRVRLTSIGTTCGRGREGRKESQRESQREEGVWRGLGREMAEEEMKREE